MQYGLYLFLLRILDMTLFTLRLMFLVRGRKLTTWVMAFGGAAAYVIGVRQVLTDMGNWAKLIGYAAGFATGVLIGMWIEERIALGYIRLQIVSARRGALLVESLRQEGFAVTEISGRGKDGVVTLLHCSLPRRSADHAEQIILDADPEAFIVAQDMRPIQRGFWPS